MLDLARFGKVKPILPQKVNLRGPSDTYLRWLLGAVQEKPIFSTRLLATLL